MTAVADRTVSSRIMHTFAGEAGAPVASGPSLVSCNHSGRTVPGVGLDQVDHQPPAQLLLLCL